MSTLALLALCLPAFAGVTPDTFVATAQPGDTLVVDKVVTLPEDTPKLDFVLLVDLTGSYWDDIEQIKLLAPGIADDIRAAVPDSRFGLATFADFPYYPWGDASWGDYGYRLNQDLTADTSAWLGAVNGLYTMNGVDWPESQYEALFQVASGAGNDLGMDDDYTDLGDIEPGQNASFRPDATKVVAITTDAEFHTGTEASYAEYYPYYPATYPGATMEETNAALLAAGIKVIAIKAPGAGWEMDAVATLTGGSVVNSSSSSADISAAILGGLEALRYDVAAVPTADCDALELAYAPAEYEDVLGGDSVSFVETIYVPLDIGPEDLDGDILTCDVEFLADDTVIGVQTITLTIPLNQPPVALCEDLWLDADGTCSADGDVDGGSYDPDGDGIDLAYSPEGPYPVGTTEVTLTVTDPDGESASCVGFVHVADTTPPVVVTTDVEMWPPNHGYWPLDLADCVTSVTDSCDGTVDIANVGYVASIYSDEPEDARGNGDGATRLDILLDTDTGFQLRAERAGSGDGRVYGVSFTVEDGAGNTEDAFCTFSVPQSNNGTPAVNSGAGAGYTVY